MLFDLEIYGRDGERISFPEFVRRCEDRSYVIVRQRHVGEYYVSTVWTGINRNLRPNDTPRIFETMVAINDEWVHQERHATEQDALKRHREIVRICCKKIRAKRSGDPPEEEGFYGEQ